MHVRTRGTNGVGGLSGCLEGEREASVNSGESILDMCWRNRGRQGAGPTVEGVVVLEDIVRAMW